jgi:hypothetical protein
VKEDLYNVLGRSLSREEYEELVKKAQAKLRLSRGQIPSGERGGQTFKPTVDYSKNPRRACSLKKHFEYGSAAYEIVGYLAKLNEHFQKATQEKGYPDGFLFVGLEDIVEHCFKGERTDGVNFAESHVCRDLALLRSLGVVSPRIEVEGRDGPREGIIVAPHAALFSREEKCCRFIGPSDVFKRHEKGLVGRFSIRADGFVWRSPEELDKKC